MLKHSEISTNTRMQMLLRGHQWPWVVSPL